VRLLSPLNNEVARDPAIRSGFGLMDDEEGSPPAGLD